MRSGIIALFLFVTANIQVYSQPDNRKFEDLIETLILDSKLTGSSYKLQVSLPKNYHDNDTTFYPVLYALDGMHSVPMINSIRQYLELSNSLENFIVVGIQGNFPRNRLMQHRIPDYTPCKNTDYENRFANLMGLEKGAVQSGRADHFLQFLTEDLIPLVEKNYRIKDQSGLLGHSLAGLFTAYIFTKRPELFDFYALSSPSLHWNSGDFLDKISWENLKNTNCSIFISVGGKEKNLHESINLFREKLAHTKNMTDYRLFENETHFSVVASAFSNALIRFAGRNEIDRSENSR